MEKVLVIGNGFLGGAVARVARLAGHDAATVSRGGDMPVDIREIGTVERAVRETDPDALINCAAVTELDKIEADPKEAYDVNAYGAENVAKVASTHSKRLVHVSTDSVFDGEKGGYSETDIPAPVNEYAKSKRLGEELVKGASDDYVVIRTNFYGDFPGGRSLFNWILDNLRASRKFGGFADIVFNPMEVENLSAGLLELAGSKYTGILHVGSDRAYSKYEFARTIAERLGYDASLVSRSESAGRAGARRPRNTTLDTSLAKRMMKSRPVGLEQWLGGIRGGPVRG